MIDGERIRLRPWIESDVEFLTGLRNDVDLQSQLMARARGQTSIQTGEWLAAITHTGDALFFVIVETSGQPVGYLHYSAMNTIDRMVDLGICLGREFQGKGFGRDALKCSESYLAHLFAIRKISLKVRADNHPAIACYQKSGFETCGLQRHHIYLGGDWHDVLLMEKFIGGSAS